MCVCVSFAKTCSSAVVIGPFFFAFPVWAHVFRCVCYFSVASAAFNLTAVWSQMGFSSQLESGCSCQQGYFQYFLNGVELRGG